MQRYFVKNNQIKSQRVTITGDDAHHISVVMRMRKQDEVIVCNQERVAYLCVIESFEKNSITLSIKEQINHNPELPINVTIAQGLIRREKTEEVIQKITELGAYQYIPLIMERSIVKLIKEQEDKKLERYQKIAKEASEQSHRTSLLQLSKAMSLKELIAIKNTFDLCLFAYEDMGRKSDTTLKSLLSTFAKDNLLVVIGPEGGFSGTEVDALTKEGFIPVGLGPRILRTETAPQYIMSVVSYQFELGETNESK